MKKKKLYKREEVSLATNVERARERQLTRDEERYNDEGHLFPYDPEYDSEEYGSDWN